MNVNLASDGAALRVVNDPGTELAVNFGAAFGSSDAMPVRNLVVDGVSVPLLCDLATGITISDITTITDPVKIINAQDTVIHVGIDGTPDFRLTSIETPVYIQAIAETVPVSVTNTVDVNIQNGTLNVAAITNLPVLVANESAIPIYAPLPLTVEVSGTVAVGGGSIGAVGSIIDPVTVMTGPAPLASDVVSSCPLEIRNQAGTDFHCVVDLGGYPTNNSIPVNLWGENAIQVSNALTIASGSIDANVTGTVALAADTHVVVSGAIDSLGGITDPVIVETDGNNLRVSIENCPIAVPTISQLGSVVTIDNPAVPVSNASGTSLEVINPSGGRLAVDIGTVTSSVPVAGYNVYTGLAHPLAVNNSGAVMLDTSGTLTANISGAVTSHGMGYTGSGYLPIAVAATGATKVANDLTAFHVAVDTMPTVSVHNGASALHVVVDSASSILNADGTILSVNLATVSAAVPVAGAYTSHGTTTTTAIATDATGQVMTVVDTTAAPLNCVTAPRSVVNAWRSLDANTTGELVFGFGGGRALGRITIAHCAEIVGAVQTAYIKIYTAFAGAVPTSSDTPVLTIPVGLGITTVFDLGDLTANACGVRATAAAADSDTTALATNEVVVGLIYY